MIVVVHNTKKVTQIVTEDGNLTEFPKKSIGATLFDLAKQYPDEILAWCDERVYSCFDAQTASTLLHHDKMILSFNPNTKEYLSTRFGYVDHASILSIPKNVSFFTWQLSATVGVIKSSLLNVLNDLVLNKDESFNYLLQSLTKRAMPNGLFCYSEPKLLTQAIDFNQKSSSDYVLFRFVKQHKSFKWLLVLFFNILVYEKRVSILPLIYGLFFATRKWNKKQLDIVEVCSKKQVISSGEIDVIVPTIGRPEHVYHVLCDLRNQSYLPKKVIVVEQNPAPNSTSQLDFLKLESWPFEIDHTFTHQPGACNARNIALSKVASEWVFMCDDDNRFEAALIEKVLANIKQYGVEVLSTSYPQVNERVDYTTIHQTTIFGSGNSFLKSSYLKQVQFDATYEFCYGEDFDFGMQLRKVGADVVYFPSPAIMHLKAPMGGFRIKPVFKWSQDTIQPIPSPTILLNYLKYRTKQQVNAYKTILFFKAVMQNKWRNPFTFVKQKALHWNASLVWANKLKETK